MSEAIQWVAVGVIALGAAAFLLKHFGVLPLRKAGSAAKGGGCGACAHCAADKPLPTAAVVTEQLKRARLPGPPR